MKFVKFLFVSFLCCFFFSICAERSVQNIRTEAYEIAQLAFEETCPKFTPEEMKSVLNDVEYRDWLERKDVDSIAEYVNEILPNINLEKYYEVSLGDNIEQLYLEKGIFVARDMPWLKKFVRAASAEAIVYVGERNDWIFKIDEAIEKILKMDANKLGQLLISDTYAFLIPQFAEKAESKQVKNVTRVYKQLQEHAAIRDRLEKISKEPVEEDFVIIIRKPARSKQSYKDTNRYLYGDNVVFSRIGDQRNQQTKDWRTNGGFISDFKSRPDWNDETIIPLLTLDDVVRNYEYAKNDPRVISAINQYVEKASEQSVVDLGQILTPEHFASTYEKLSKKVSTYELRRKLEDRVVKIWHSNRYDLLSKDAQRFFYKKGHSISMLRDKADACVKMLEGQEENRHEMGKDTADWLAMKAAQNLLHNPDLVSEVEALSLGAARKIYQLAANITYERIDDAVKYYTKHETAETEKALLRFLKDMRPHTRNPEFRNLIGKKDGHYEDKFQILEAKAREINENRKIIQHFGLSKSSLTVLARSFNIDPALISTIYEDSKRNVIQVESVQLLGELQTYKTRDERIATMGDLTHAVCLLNQENQTEKAGALLQHLRIVGNVLLGVCKEIRLQVAEEAKSVATGLVLGAVMTGATGLGISVSPVVAASFIIGSSLYYVYQRPEVLITNLKELSSAIKEGKPYEAGQLATRLGLETVGSLFICRRVVKTFQESFKKGILDDTVKVVKKSIKKTREQSRTVHELSNKINFGKEGTSCYKGNLVTINKESYIPDHTFSEDHRRRGIMDLGINEVEILQCFTDQVIKADKLGFLKEGKNQIDVIINGHKATIRCYIENGEALSLSGFKGTTDAKWNNIIKFE